MNRRCLCIVVAGLCLLLAAPLAAEAQQTRKAIPRIGFLTTTSPEDSPNPGVDGFREGLRARGPLRRFASEPGRLRHGEGAKKGGHCCPRGLKLAVPRAIHPAAAAFDPARAHLNPGGPLHEGAARHFTDQERVL